MTQKLVISRKEWLYGDSTASCLYDPDTGKKCCIGIYLHSRGVPESVLEDVADIANFVGNHGVEELPGDAHWLFDGETDIPGQEYFYALNDADEGRTLMQSYGIANSRVGLPPGPLTQEMRENALKKKFAEHGVKVEFID